METSTLPAPAEDERTFALLAHVLMIATWWIGPLVIYLVKRDSRFVSFHALQALFWQVFYSVLMMGGGILWFVSMFTMAGPGQKGQGPPAAFLLSFFAFWLAMMVGWTLTLVLGIVYGIKASKGEWAAYPVIGGWARRLAGI